MSNARSAATKAGADGDVFRGVRRLRAATLPAAPHRPTPVQRGWLARGLDQPGGKLPLFDRDGQRIDPRTIRSCIEQGWVEPWFSNPLKPDWLVCKLTAAGRLAIHRR